MRLSLVGIVFTLIAACLVSLVVRGGLAVALAWPALSFLVVAAAYFADSVRLFGKGPDGSRHPLAMVVLLPYTTFAGVVWRLQVAFSREPATSVVNDSLIVARRLLPGELPGKVSILCDLTSELLDAAPLREHPGYVALPILDGGSLSAAELLVRLQGMDPPRETRIVIHCANGHGRTGLVAALWLVIHGHASSAEGALTLLHRARPGIKLRPNQRRTLDEAVERFYSRRGRRSSVEGRAGSP